MIPYDSKQKFIPGSGFLNRTRIYLYPSIVLLNSYKDGFSKVRDIFMCCSYSNESIIIYYQYQNNISVLRNLVSLLKTNNELLEHGLFNADIYYIRVKPEINYSAFEEGSYSKIYTPKQIQRVFSANSKTRQVLEKHPDAKQRFVDNLNEWFNTHRTIDDLEITNGKRVPLKEYDIPPCMNQEIYESKWILQQRFTGGIKKTSVN